METDHSLGGGDQGQILGEMRLPTHVRVLRERKGEEEGDDERGEERVRPWILSSGTQADQKRRIKDAKTDLEAPYLYALVDGRKEKVGNFRAEPPGLFRGRGEHPKKGTLKVSSVILVWEIEGEWLIMGRNGSVPTTSS